MSVSVQDILAQLETVNQKEAAAPKYFGTYKNTADFGRHAFFLTLYHELNTRKGFVIQSVLQDGECKCTRSGESISKLLDTNKLLELQKYGKKASCYTTVNVFRKPKRTSESLRYRTAFFLDIDIHDENDERDTMLLVRKNETIKVLEQAFNDKKLPIPTMITDTGRGFALYYVLERSIANVPKAKNIRTFFDLVYTQLVKKTDGVLSAAKNPMVGTVDTKVCDAARLCRIPGTYNSKADAMCKVSFIRFTEDKKPFYFELGDIAQFVLAPKKEKKEENGSETNEETKKKVKRIVKKAADESGRPNPGFCYTRMRILDQLQEMRGEKCDNDCRELMLFILFNTMLPVYGLETAKKHIVEFNAKFTTPLSGAEVGYVPLSAFRVASKDGHAGFYKMTNRYIIDTLHMTQEEIEATGIGTGSKEAVRQAKREEKKAVAAQIEDLLRTTTSDIMPYAKIAEMHKVSENTVKRIAKKLGIFRHHYPVTIRRAAKDPESIISAPRSIVSAFEGSMALPCLTENSNVTCTYEQPIICLNNKENKTELNDNNQEQGKTANTKRDAHNAIICVADQKNANANTNIAAGGNVADDMEEDVNGDFNRDAADNLSSDITKTFNMTTFLKAWEHRLSDIGWAGQAMMKQIKEVAEIAGNRNWDISDMAAHLNSNVELYKNWEDTFIISSEQEWLKKYLRKKRRESWNGPDAKPKKKADKKEDKPYTVEADKVYEIDRRFFGITVKNYPWLDSRWLKLVMRVFRNEWKTKTYRINGKEVSTEIINACFVAMRQSDIVKLLEHLGNYNGKIEHPYSFIVSSVYRMKQEEVGDNGCSYEPDVPDEEDDFWKAYFAEDEQDTEQASEQAPELQEEIAILAGQTYDSIMQQRKAAREELEREYARPAWDDDDDEEEEDVFRPRHKLML